MTVRKIVPSDMTAFDLGGAQFVIFVCDTTAELPSGVAPMKFRKGDLAVTNDTNNLYLASSTTTWKLLGAGSSLSPATTVANEQGFGLSPVVGTDLDYAREDHSHGSVGHDSHANLTGVSPDQHHADVHGSGKHTGGILALQEEGSGLGSVATLNIVGAGATASFAGTTGTITIPGTSAAPTQFVVKTVDESVTSSTVMQNDNELLFPMLANEIWMVTGTYLIDNNGLAGPALNIGLSVPSGTVRWGDATYFSGGTPSTLLTESGTVNRDPQARAAGLVQARLYYHVVCGATPGNFQIRWAQAVSTAVATFIRKNSSLIAVQVA